MHFVQSSSLHKHGIKAVLLVNNKTQLCKCDILYIVEVGRKLFEVYVCK